MCEKFGKRRRAFTLIEMMLNLVIMMLLAAIIFPVFSRVRDSARRSSCQSNMREIGMAFIMYSQDYDEKLPCGTIAEPSPFLGQGWASQLMPYIQTATVFKCPSDPGEQKKPMVSISYAFNPNLVRDSANANTFLLRPLPAFVEPGRTVLATEIRYGRFDPSTPSDNNSPITNGVSLFGGGRGNGSTNLQIATGLFTNSPADNSNCNNRDVSGYPFDPAHLDSPHGGGANYLAADGHVKWLRSTSVSAGVYPNVGDRAQFSTTAEGVQYTGVGKHQMTYSHY